MSENAAFIAVTSFCGGVGTSSLAVAIGRILSRLHDLNVLYIACDRLSEKCGPEGGADRSDFFKATVLNCSWNDFIERAVAKDEYELSYIKCNEIINPLQGGLKLPRLFLERASKGYDVVILDIPSNSVCAGDFLPLCEHIVLCYGTAGVVECKYIDLAADILKECFPKAFLHEFFCEHDEYSFEDGSPDIHGEYGAHVRELIRRIGILKTKSLPNPGDPGCCL